MIMTHIFIALIIDIALSENVGEGQSILFIHVVQSTVRKESAAEQW
jgi:hypothetical protein